ncbi:protein far-red impaired response 1 isoform x3 [Gigaspora margarita]|uniref:Protein far-red impaired response 1 isoform x3 n=1 Tax=Gigaspora margarita TaxID=4874 RepID=A0A8H4EPF1_GIGMA|nr:protein far-red impaired response 1 isoform x3 [Gigaspora margarita]
MNECLLYRAQKIENWKNLIGREDQVNKNQIYYKSIEVTKDAEFAEDDYESIITNLDSLIKCIDQSTIQEVWCIMTIEQNKEHFVVICKDANHLCTCMTLVTKGLVSRHFFSVMLNSDKAMFHIGLIPARWYNEITSNSQDEAAISIINKKNLLDSNEPVYEHQIEMNYSFLNEIRQTQIISDTVKQNLNFRVKYNQGFGYAKKAVELALETGLENELNKLLQNWIKKTEKKFYCDLNESSKENLPDISNPYLTSTKSASRKHIKSALEDSSSKYYGKSKICTITDNLQDSNRSINKLDENNDKQFEASGQQFEIQSNEKKSSKHVCGYCRGIRHNSRTCEHKK